MAQTFEVSPFLLAILISKPTQKGGALGASRPSLKNPSFKKWTIFKNSTKPKEDIFKISYPEKWHCVILDSIQEKTLLGHVPG